MTSPTDSSPEANSVRRTEPLRAEASSGTDALLASLAQAGEWAHGRTELAAGRPMHLPTRFDASGYSSTFVGQLSQAIESARTDTASGALLTITFRNLGMVISGYGSDVCEALLRHVIHEIHAIVGADDSIERIQRDQIAIILRRVTDEEAAYLAERIRSHIRQVSCDSPHGSVYLLFSLHQLMFPRQASHARDALNASLTESVESADAAPMRQGRPHSEQSALDRQEMGLANYLNKAIGEQRLRMAFQPIIDARTGDISHYEALLRLRSDDGKLSSAGALIPIAERMGLIDIIDALVLDLVAEELRRDANVVIAFNVSNLSTCNPQWLEQFQSITQTAPDIAPRMIVEITETAAQRDLRQAAYFVAAIQATGAMVALDDFGSGYTSFRQLKSLSVDMVKIDGAFIKDLVDNPDNRFFVKTLLDFTHAFGLRSVAECVETGEVAKMLMELGVECLQGYYFGRPDTRRAWLKDGEYSID